MISGNASELVIGKSQVQLLMGALGSISFLRVCLCHPGHSRNNSLSFEFEVEEGGAGRDHYLFCGLVGPVLVK